VAAQIVLGPGIAARHYEVQGARGFTDGGRVCEKRKAWTPRPGVCRVPGSPCLTLSISQPPSPFRGKQGRTPVKVLLLQAMQMDFSLLQKERKFTAKSLVYLMDDKGSQASGGTGPRRPCLLKCAP
jgi:hypothetical protein